MECQTYFSVDDGPNRLAVARLRDDAVNERQISCRRTGRAQIQVLVAAARRPLVQQAVVYHGEGRILDPDREALCDVIGERTRGEHARE